nr:MAG TPA: hypothetical protein [Caudoviricetes sp.]
MLVPTFFNSLSIIPYFYLSFYISNDNFFPQELDF